MSESASRLSARSGLDIEDERRAPDDVDAPTCAEVRSCLQDLGAKLSVKEAVHAVDSRDDDNRYGAVCQLETRLGRGNAATPRDMDAELPFLVALARRLTGNPHDAHDLVQDAMVRALPALSSVTSGPHLRAWLITIVRRLHIDRVRRLAREPKSVPIDEAGVESLGGQEPDGDAEDAMGIEDVEAALGALPEAFRRVFVLHELEGRPYREIADTLDIPLATVGTRLNRARTKLRALLADRHSVRGAVRAVRPLASTHSERLLLDAAPGRRVAGDRRR